MVMISKDNKTCF